MRGNGKKSATKLSSNGPKPLTLLQQRCICYIIGGIKLDLGKDSYFQNYFLGIHDSSGNTYYGKKCV